MLAAQKKKKKERKEKKKKKRRRRSSPFLEAVSLSFGPSSLNTNSSLQNSYKTNSDIWGRGMHLDK
jgi:hypothetical protein